MNHWPFIIAAYGLTIVGMIAALALSLIAMRRAERKAEALSRR